VGRGARTTALLVRPDLPTSGGRAVRLPWRPWSRRTLTRRGLAVATVAGVQVISVHLPLSPGERRRHLEDVLDLVDNAVVAGRPLVLGGDLNEAPDGPTWAALTQRLVDVGVQAGPTFPARSPRRRIDALLTTGLTVQQTHRPSDDATRRASDHLPLTADLVVDPLP
ncbi:endonuclease/exonuclease/phosphatase family protein, partial [Actinotalea sp. C106]|uniref:endonuclease/exonuclease/phosphatase family protein n=1 Tax=Actinotalea sp. C106 TaxID=2908644 RepID=UPI0035ABBC2D